MLFIHRAVGSILLIDPVFLLPYHPFSARYGSNPTRSVKRARFRAITKRFKPITFVTGIPLINDNFDWHIAAPYTTLTFCLVNTGVEFPMASFPISFEVRWNA